MSYSQIQYHAGGPELLDDIQPLWEQLNQHHAAVSSYFTAEFQSKTFPVRRQALLEKYADGQIRVDIARAQNRNIGYLISAITPNDTGEIESIYIEEGFRGQAIGDQLMRRTLDWLDKHHVHTKVIAVAVGNERAYKFYARFGFYPRIVTLKQRSNANL